LSQLLALDSFKLLQIQKYILKFYNRQIPHLKKQRNKTDIAQEMQTLKNNNQIMYKLMEGTTFALDDGQSFVIYV